MLDHELSRLLLSLGLLLAFALGAGQLFQVLRLPRVIGEICAGLLLGPSLMGLFMPELRAWLFEGFEYQGRLLSAFYWMGLILLMFTAGFKIPTDSNRGNKPLLFMLVLGGMGLPFLFGFFASSLLPSHPESNRIAFSLVIAIASAVTSIPVLTRIFLDLDMLQSRFAQVVLTAAAVQDLLLWVVLSIALAIQQEGVANIGDAGFVAVLTIAFAVFSIAVIPSVLQFAGRLVMSQPEGALLGYTLVVCLMMVSLASALKINVVFGALLAGLIIGRLQGDRLTAVKQNITSFSVWFFVPVYFALVGLKMNLPAHFNAALIFWFMLASSLVKVASVTILARLTRIPWMRAFDYGMTMNARGGPGIVLASLAYASKIIGDELFVAIVLVSILTSLISGSWLLWRRPILCRNN